MKSRIHRENRNWPRENSQNTKRHRLILNDKKPDFSQKQTKLTKNTELKTLFLLPSFASRSSVQNSGRYFPLKSLLHSAHCALSVLLRPLDFGIRVKLFAVVLLLANAGSALADVRYVDAKSTNPLKDPFV